MLDDRLDWASGVLYFQEDATYYNYSAGTSPYEAAVINAGGNWVSQDTESLGVYTQGTFRVTNASNVTLGLPYTEDEKDALIWGRSALTSGQPFESYRPAVAKFNF